MPQRNDWYDAKWPVDEGEYVYVDYDNDVAENDEAAIALFSAIEDTVGGTKTPATRQYLIVTSDPTTIKWPSRWLDLTHPRGGIPRNVWVGMRCSKPEQLTELEGLRRVRARRLFLLMEMGPRMLDAVTLDFEAWRCSSCGMRGEHPKPRDCPNHSLCDRDTIGPQIHWIVGDVTGLDKYGIKVWSEWTTERPE